MKQNTQSWMSRAIFATVFALAMTVVPNSVHAEESGAAPAVKEWTFLLFLNGHNNLDSYGAFNINQMEQVGSNDQINMVVQWASLKNKQTKRLYVTKDNNTNSVTSPVVQTMAPVDMGDYKNLVEFVRWGVQNYPAKHYFIAVWNHGAGWHLERFRGGDMQVQDISFDDNTGHHISTEELGVAMTQAAQIIGHKVDVYGSDACLMAMGEVAAEMKDSVDYFVGSEETEPGNGWPYNTFFARFAANKTAAPVDVATYLTEEYLKAYNGGIYGTQDVTFSAYDMSKFQAYMDATKALTVSLAGLAPADISKAKTAANSTQAYAYDDYKDLHDFLDKVGTSAMMVDAVSVEAVKDSIHNLVISGGGVGSYKNSHGISIWMPTYASDLNRYSARYSKLVFNQNTNWLNFLTVLNK